MTHDYDRSTTATSLEGLPDPIREAMVAHAKSRMITLQPDVRAFVTHSRRLRMPLAAPANCAVRRGCDRPARDPSVRAGTRGCALG
jgi:hypothetical protein